MVEPRNGHVTISEGAPSGNFAGENCLWFDPAVSRFYYLKDGQWVELPVPPHVPNHEFEGVDKITQLGTVHFRENVFAGVGQNTKGITQDILLGEGTLSIKKGIIVDWTPV